MIETILSEKNKVMIICNGFLYRKAYEGANSIGWRCTVPSCKAKIVTPKENLNGGRVDLNAEHTTTKKKKKQRNYIN